MADPNALLLSCSQTLSQYPFSLNMALLPTLPRDCLTPSYRKLFSFPLSPGLSQREVPSFASSHSPPPHRLTFQLSGGHRQLPLSVVSESALLLSRALFCILLFLPFQAY